MTLLVNVHYAARMLSGINLIMAVADIKTVANLSSERLYAEEISQLPMQSNCWKPVIPPRLRDLYPKMAKALMLH